MNSPTSAPNDGALPIVQIDAWLANVRGGTRASRVRDSQGRHHILKLQDNPQGNASLIAELVGTQIFAALGLPVPQISIATIANPAAALQIQPNAPILPHQAHIAISFPVNPNLQSVYDILPDPSWALLTDRECFWGALVADKWLANLDSRQAVFVRRRSIEPGAVQNVDLASVSGIQPILIDQGLCFNGRSLDFKVAPAHGLYPSAIPYHGLKELSQLGLWIKRAQALPEEFFRSLIQSIPKQWLTGDLSDRLQSLCETLLRRAQSLPRLLDPSLSYLLAGG